MSFRITFALAIQITLRSMTQVGVINSLPFRTLSSYHMTQALRT